MSDALRARVLAQVGADGPVSVGQLAAALAVDAEEIDRAAFVLEQQRGWIVSVLGFTPARRRIRLFEITDAGRIEASGGAQMSLEPRPRVAVQPALF